MNKRVVAFPLTHEDISILVPILGVTATVLIGFGEQKLLEKVSRLADKVDMHRRKIC